MALRSDAVTGIQAVGGHGSPYVGVQSLPANSEHGSAQYMTFCRWPIAVGKTSGPVALGEFGFVSLGS